MKRSKSVHQCGPYRVDSISQDGCGVRMVVYPAYPKHGEDWAITRARGEGGGPSIFTCIALAKELEAFLNQAYSKKDVEDWKQTLDAALKEKPND